MINGLVLLPVILSFIGPTYSENDKASKKLVAVESESVNGENESCQVTPELSSKSENDAVLSQEIKQANIL